MKNLKNKIIIIVLLIFYSIFVELTHIAIPCPIHRLTGFYCPGCGVSRMLLSIIKLDFKKAFSYNQLLFILLPFGIFLFIESIISDIKNRTPLYKKINNIVWYILIAILLIYGVLRNIFPVLAP
jgi:hypothetical protein